MMITYGSQTLKDIEVLEAVLAAYANKPCCLLEIGVLDGGTARGIKAFMEAQGSALTYWGMDNESHPSGGYGRPFIEANFVMGDSAECYHLVPAELDVALLDGCHCINHVILDTLHYGAKVKTGGFLLFHDTAPHAEQTMKDPHGPNTPDFHNSVLHAHRLLRFPTVEWEHWMTGIDPKHPWGGMSAYRKL